MRRGKLFLLGLLTGCLAVPGAAFAQLYQWRDANGRTVFSDSPPPSSIPPGNIVKMQKARAAPAAAEEKHADDGKSTASAAGTAAKADGPKSIAEREAEFKKRQAEAAAKAEKDQKLASDEKRREDQCRGMRQSLAAMESGQRVRRFNDKGEPYFVEDAERARDVEKYRRDMATAKCS